MGFLGMWLSEACVLSQLALQLSKRLYTIVKGGESILQY